MNRLAGFAVGLRFAAPGGVRTGRVQGEWADADLGFDVHRFELAVGGRTDHPGRGRTLGYPQADAGPAVHFTERRARIGAHRRVAGLQAFPGDDGKGSGLAGRSRPLAAVESDRLRGRRLAGLRSAGPAQVSRRGARRNARRHHDPRADDTRRRGSGVHQAGIPSWRWPTSRSASLLQLRPRCLTPVVGVSAATAQRCAVGAFP